MAGEPSGEMEHSTCSATPESVDIYFVFVAIVFPLTLLFESEDSIRFLINLGALGEHLQRDSDNQISQQEKM